MPGSHTFAVHMQQGTSVVLSSSALKVCVQGRFTCNSSSFRVSSCRMPSFCFCSTCRYPLQPRSDQPSQKAFRETPRDT